ncbi:MAG: ABC transporter ATP-binding protein [Chitinispirillaceae bacterium]|nr:ABC transporter ATP-binding protein [Chitinispirillaceae bacterium]
MVTLRIDGLEYGYSTKPVFSDVSLDIGSGEVVSIVGRNGAGKSTLLKCINHILKPIKGMVLLGEIPVAAMSHRQRAQRFGYLSQKSEQLFPATVFEVVLTGRYPHSPMRFTRRDEEIAADVIAMMELGEFASRLYNRLSGGEQQQVLIARALAQGADILLFDEPTNNLDLKHQLQIMRLIRSLSREKAITSILAIHDLNFAATFSDRVVVLHGGKVFANGQPAAVFTKEVVREAFGVEVKIYDHHGVPHMVMVDG